MNFGTRLILGILGAMCGVSILLSCPWSFLSLAIGLGLAVSGVVMAISSTDEDF